MIAAPAFLLAFLALAGPEEPPRETASPPASQGDETPPPLEGEGELLDVSRSAAGRVERIRGLRFSAPPPAVRASAAVRAAVASRRVAAAVPEAALGARGRAWADLGMGGPETPRHVLEALAADLQGIAFDSVGSKVLVDPVLLSPDDFAPRETEDPTSSVLLATGVRPDEPALVHVLMHALQRSRIGTDPMGGTTDATLAASAWAEGEANLVAVLFLFEGLGIQGQVIGHTLDPGELLGGTLLPAGLDILPGVEGLLLDFVFREGYAQAASSYNAGGFRAIDRAMTGRRTTRDVLHPDRAPLPATDLPAPAAPKGFVLADRDSLGEQGIIALVSSLTGKDNLGLMAGDGWAGDALFRFEPEGVATASDGITVWATRWVSPEEAADFEYGLERSLSGRFPAVSLLRTGETERALTAGGRHFRLSRSGVEVVLRISSQVEDKPRVPTAPTKAPVKRSPAKAK